MKDNLYPLMTKEQQAAHDCLIDLLAAFEQRAPHLHSHLLDLSGMSMPHSTVFFQQKFYQVSFRGCDLSYTSFPGCTFRECDLDGTDLSGADLRGTFLWRCSFVEVENSTTNTDGCQAIDCSYRVSLYDEKPRILPQTLLSKRELMALYPR